MIEVIIENMNRLINELKDSINLDIEDIKAAKQEELLKRNDKKLSIIENITNLKQDLKMELKKQNKQIRKKETNEIIEYQNDNLYQKILDNAAEHC